MVNTLSSLVPKGLEVFRGSYKRYIVFQRFIKIIMEILMEIKCVDILRRNIYEEIFEGYFLFLVPQGFSGFLTLIKERKRNCRYPSGDSKTMMKTEL